MEEKWIKHYSNYHKILLVGEGDFSFGLSLANAFGSADNIVATSLDSQETLILKYGGAMSNVNELRNLGCTILHGVDAKTMYSHYPINLKKYDRIVFNFPHAGFQYRERDTEQIELHKKVVKGFLRSAKYLVSENGEIHVTHKISYPFYLWDIPELGHAVGLHLTEEVPFDISDYPGYINKRGSGSSDQTFPVGSCTTFKFTLTDL